MFSAVALPLFLPVDPPPSLKGKMDSPCPSSSFSRLCATRLHSAKQGASVVHTLVLLKGTLAHSLRRKARGFLQLN